MTLFSPLELAAIHIGKRDRLACLAGDGRCVRLLSAIFGIAPLPPLADLRLEALRQLVIALRRTRQRPTAAITASVSRAQIDYLLNDLGPPVLLKSSPAIVPVRSSQARQRPSAYHAVPPVAGGRVALRR